MPPTEEHTATVPTAPVDPMLPRPARVTRRRVEAADVVSLGVSLEDGEVPAPGQFHMLWAPGVGEIPVSASRLPAHPGAPVEHTVRAVGAVSAALTRLQPGDPLGVRGPYGTGWDVAGAAGGDVVVLGGGIGLAPLRPVVDELLARRDRYGRLALVAGARSPELLLFGDDLDAWSARPDLQVVRTVDHAAPGWSGAVGVVPAALRALEFDPVRTVAFVCGPEVMIRFAARALVAAGVPADRVRVSIERSMACGVGLCGHCQLGGLLLCRDGPVLPWSRVEPLLAVPGW